jgi:hypothetical protein
LLSAVWLVLVVAVVVVVVLLVLMMVVRVGCSLVLEQLNFAWTAQRRGSRSPR